MEEELRPAIEYDRISETDQNVPKIENQHKQLAELADANRYRIVARFADDGIKASKAGTRDDADFGRLLADLPKYANQNAVLIATEEARLARNEMEKLSLRIMCAQYGISWHTKRDGYVDLTDPMSDAMAGIRGIFDSMESKRKGQRQKDAARIIREQGLPYVNGPRPFGRERDCVTICEAEAAWIRKAADAILDPKNGKSLWAVTQEWNANGVLTPRTKNRGGKAWTPGGVRQALCKWSNAAVPSFYDEPLPDVKAHPSWLPIISREQVEQLRIVLYRNPAPKTGVQTMLGGILRCHCGQPMRGTGNNGKNYPSYRCAAKGKGGHANLSRKLADATIRKAIIDLYLLNPRASHADDAEAVRLADLYTELERVHDSQARLMDAYTDADVPMTKTQFAQKNSELVTREANLQTAISQTVAASVHARMLTETRRMLFSSPRIPLSLAVDAKRELGDIFDSLSLDDKRRLILATLSVVVMPGIGAERIKITCEGLPQDD